LLLAPGAAAAGGSYLFDGGSAGERVQIVAALDASSFPWGIVPGPVRIHVVHGRGSSAAPGQIWIDADSLSAGRFAWGEIQHEYAHVVDFALLDDAARAQFRALLGGRGWLVPGAAHDDQTAERFAESLAASYWISPDNSAEATVRPAAFRALLTQVLAGRRLALRRSGTGEAR
jgi:hypothetical protein